MIDAINTFAELGLSPIPVFPADHPGRPKRPVGSWKQHQDHVPTLTEIRQLFPAGAGYSVALVAGRVSGNLEILDFDAPELFAPFVDQLRAARPELAGRLLEQQTPSGGYHLLYRCTEPVQGNLKLARSADGRETMIETRGEGGYFLVAPSPGYRLESDISLLATITAADRAFLHSLARSFDLRTEQTREPKREARSHHVDGERPGDVLEREADWANLLTADGWQYLQTVADRHHYSRPGKTPPGVSATVNEMGLYVFSSNTPLPAEQPIKKLAYVALFRFNGDFSRAARWVVSEYPGHFPKNTGPRQEEPPFPDDDDFRTIPDIPDNSGHSGHYTQSSGHSGHVPDMFRTLSGHVPDNFRTLAGDVLAFIEMDPEPFTNNDIYSELCARSRREKKTIHDALCYYEKKGKIIKIDGKRGAWEVVEDKPEAMDLLSVDTEPFNISLPLDISDYVNVRPGGIILVSGSNNAGKTVFLLWVVRKILSLHIPPHLSYERKGVPPINYLNSEMSPQELVARIRSFGDDPAEWVKHVTFIERSHSFDRVIAPDGINLIDFLEVNEDFFQAGKLIADIHKKLKSGIAIIAMQKKQGHAFAKGGEMTLEKPRLAINLDKNEPHGFTCKIAKAKEAVDFTRNIQGMTRDFVITGDSRILPTSDWRHVNEKQRAAINTAYDRNHLPQRVIETGQHYKTI